MLEVRKGKSSKSYENEFFRKISVELSQVFEQRQWDGILLGMPECIVREDLQIDCLLVTESQIIIIDFKDYSGTLELPSEENFGFGRWVINGDVTVKGGSSPNPFSQLGKQRIKLIDELKYRLHDFERKSISTVVCFHDNIEVVGRIPRQFQVSFSIVDSNNYLNKIVDILDVMADRNMNYLSDKGRQTFTETLFVANEYQFYIQFEPEFHERRVEERTKNINSLQEIREFLISDSKIMTLTGNTRSGKTALIPDIREIAFDLGFTDAPVFAYSNRLRRKMLRNNPELEEVDSLFNTVFDFNSDTIDEFYKKTIPIKGHDEIHDQDKALYIIDDSQLITNSNFDSDLLQFGSGHLLDDVLNYIDLESNPERKVIFIGDKNKLSYGSNTENALNPEYLKALLDIKNIFSEIGKTELPDNDGDSEIIKVCNKISKNIGEDRYNELFIYSSEEISVCEREDKTNVLREAWLNPTSSSILLFSNKQANQVNIWIKKQLIKNGGEIGAKDYIVFNTTIQAYGPRLVENDLSPFDNNEQPFSFVEPKRVDNGYFGEVITVDHDHIIEKTVVIKDEKVILRFIPCQIKLQDGSIIETLVFDNYLKATKNELETNEIIAYQIVLSSYEKEVFDKEPFERSVEYQEMLQHPDLYIISKKDGKEIYRDSKDKRKLTRFEKAYRDRVLKKLKVPTSEYFKLLNAARVKFGWAMTVNKAMAYSFETVFFNTQQDENRGKTNKAYFKWIYTGISTGLNNVQLINWKPISPFLKTEFSESTSITAPNKSNIILSLSNGDQTSTEQLQNYLETQLSGVATISNIAPRNYLEIVTLEMNDRKIELFFDYNGRGEMKIPRLKSGEQEDFGHILPLLKPVSKDVPSGVMHSFLQEFVAILENYDIQMKVLDFHDWNLILSFSNKENNVRIQLWYTGDGMISKFYYIDGSKELFSEIVGLIKEIYVLD
ncbi:NERD domain-containing protein [Bacillus sp. sid0103]|uniref:nuclease-related domain-containing protein n=1 Tax=Bacillus sp. sid0103 TaxID=2856337 RepID=UPI001C43BF5A|nr:nuclease-related domain-containing protein [Bacillus sp. sid0103]MBV7504803.1 NERD domain-containing protein [Bacillus sp. sid0103]